MTITSSEPDGLRIIICLAFDRRAPVDEVEAFKQCIIASDHVIHSDELSGTFDLIVEARVDDLADYHRRLRQSARELAQLVERYEANFVCRRHINESDDPLPSMLWIPCREGLERVDCEAIRKVTAEGDYMRLHTAERSWLYHSTMAALLDRLDPDRFLQLHRSTVVRADFIDRIVHDDARWIALLGDGTAQRIAKSHVGHVLRRLRDDSSPRDGVSAKAVELIEAPGRAMEHLLHG